MSDELFDDLDVIVVELILTKDTDDLWKPDLRLTLDHLVLSALHDAFLGRFQVLNSALNILQRASQ